MTILYFVQHSLSNLYNDLNVGVFKRVGGALKGHSHPVQIAQLIKMVVPSEIERALDALSDDEVEYIRLVSKGFEENIFPVLMYMKKKNESLNGKEYDAFVCAKKCLSDNQLTALRNVYANVVPEGNTNLGIILAHNFLEPRQQTNLDAAKRGESNGTGDNRSDLDTNKVYSPVVSRYYDKSEHSYYVSEDVEKECEKSMHMIRSVGIFGLCDNPKFVHVTSFMVEIELLMPATTDDGKCIAFGENIFKTLIMGVVRKTCMGAHLNELYCERTTSTCKIFFTTYVSSYALFVNSCHEFERAVLPGKLHIVFTSLKKPGYVDFVRNTIVCLFCCLTNRYKATVETTQDHFILMLITILVLMQYVSDGNTLKRNGMSKSKIGPMFFMIAESGLFEVEKYLKNRSKQDNDDDDDDVFPLNSTIQKFVLNLALDHNLTSTNIMLDKNTL